MKISGRIEKLAGKCLSRPLWRSAAAVIFGAAVALGLSGCKDEPDLGGPDTSDQEDTDYLDWVSCLARTCFNFAGNDGELSDVLRERLPNVTDLSTAEVVVISSDNFESACAQSGLKELYDRGGLVVITYPNDDTDNLVEEFFTDGYCPLTDSTDAILFAFNNQSKFYIIDGGEPVTTEDAEGEAVHSEDADDQHVHGDDYFHRRVECFINWIRRNYDDPDVVWSFSRAASRSSDHYDPAVTISDNYIEVYHSFPVCLHHQISDVLNKKDRLDKDSDIEYNYRMYPLYLFSCNGGDAPGDYYIVEGSVTAHNAPLWDPYTSKHVGSLNNIVGYYMRSLTSKYEIQKKSGSGKQATYTALTKPRFYHEPTPSTTTGSTTYTSGFSTEINGSLSGGFNDKNGWSLQGGLGFRCQWSKSESYTLPDVTTALQTGGSDKSITYINTVQNIRNEWDFGQWDRDYPLVCRNDMSFSNAWIWKVPYGSDGVNDGSEASFAMKITPTAVYEVYYWYRAALYGNRRTFTISGNPFIMEIKAPNRKPFGVLAVRNASNLTMAHIKIWRQEDVVNGSAPEAKVHAEIPSSYNLNELAKWKLLVGKYRIEFDMVNPDEGNKVESHWKYDNIEIKMGRDESSSTTEVSTVDAVRVN